MVPREGEAIVAESMSGFACCVQGQLFISELVPVVRGLSGFFTS